MYISNGANSDQSVGACGRQDVKELLFCYFLWTVEIDCSAMQSPDEPPYWRFVLVVPVLAGSARSGTLIVAVPLKPAERFTAMMNAK
jgi:hypothetical protein